VAIAGNAATASGGCPFSNLIYHPRYVGRDWNDNAARDKQQEIQKQIDESHTADPWPNIPHLLELLVENMNIVFDHTGDDMPTQKLFDMEERSKLTHSIGCCAPCKFISYGNHPYTGIFRGCDTAVIRMCLARQWDLMGDRDKFPISPSVSMKFFRDGQKSANTHLMYSLMGQASFNMFQHDLTNHVPQPNLNDETIPVTKRGFVKILAKASEWPAYLGSSDLALIDALGTVEEKPEFPFRIIFHPTKAIHTMFPDEPQKGPQYYIPQLEKIPVGTIYEVFVQEFPSSDAVTGPIGRVDLLDKFVRTKFGDRDLFFQHTRMESDLQLRPDWYRDTKRIFDFEGSCVPTYHHPDLPWN
jgi:hypothetical protein